MNQSLIANYSLSIALFFALFVHALMMFYIHIPKTEPRQFTRDIDVVIVDSATQKPIDDNHFLAQANQQGAANETHKAQQLASIQAQKAIKPIKPVPAIKPVKQVQAVKPIVEHKQIIKTPPPVKQTPVETKRIIKPPEPVKPKPVQKIEWSKPKTLDEETTLPVEKLSPITAKKVSPTGLVQAKELEQIEKINHAIEQTVHDEAVQTPKKTEKPHNDEQPVKEIEKHTEKSKTEKHHNPFSATELAQQISQYGSDIQQDAIKNQTKTKSVNQVTTNKYVAAQYLKDWESKVERTGNMNYPAAAMKAGFSATLTMEVHINMDGSIKDMIITRSSGNQDLDNAAKKIVSMSAPFPPLPEALREELEILKITRVWKFSDESGLITQ